MNPTIKARIESIRRGEVPEGYKRTKIGIVPNEWNEYNLGDFLEEYKEKTMISNQYPVLTSSRKGLMLQKEYYSRRQVTTDDNIGYNVIPFGFITYRSRSDDGRFCFNENTIIEKGIISYFYPVFSVSANAVKTFVLYLMNETIYRRMIPYAEGTAQQVLSLKQLCSLKYFFPTVSEQEKIAEILAGQDRVIALKEKLLEEKQKQKKYLMQQLLTGKKRLPGFSGKRKNFRLFDLCQIIADGDWIESKDQSDRGVRLIQTGNIGIGQFLNKFNKAHYISEETFTRLSCCEVFPGDVLLSRLPDPIGRACIIPKLNCRMITAVDCTILRFKKEVFADLFVYYSCLDAWQNKMILLSRGSTRKRITRKEIENAVIALPINEKEQITIAEILSTADKEIELLKKDIEQEKLKKKSLMQLLLTGIVRVDELVS